MIKRINVPGWSLFLFLAVALEVAVRAFDLGDSVAAPSSTFRALGESIVSGDLTAEIGTTLGSYVQGLAAAIVLGVLAGTILGSSRTLMAASSVVIEFLRPIPAVALIPLAIRPLRIRCTDASLRHCVRVGLADPDRHPLRRSRRQILLA